MKQVIWIISCYLYGAAVILLVILLLLVYLRGQVNHLPNPFAKKNLAYRQPAQARGILFGKKLSLLAYSPEQDEGHILVMGPSGTGKTSALLIPTLRSWQGTALVVDISGDISANVNTPNKIVFDPTSENCIPYDVFASINEVTDDTEAILFCLDEFASFGKLQIVESLRKLRKRRIRILVLTQSVSDVDMIYGKDERKAMLGNFKFTVILGCKDTETQEYFSKMIGEKHSLLAIDPNQKPQPIIKPADLAHLEQDLFVICDDGAIRLRKNFYFK